MGKNKNRLLSLLICFTISCYQHYSFASPVTRDFLTRYSIYKTSRLLVGKEEINRKNKGEGIDLVIDWTRLYKYEKRPYCGATVQYCIEKSGYRIPKDVENPLAARGWFKSDIIYNRGKFKGLYKHRLKLMDIVGFYSGDVISHVGFYLWELDRGDSKTFEGNTSKPGNREVEGFFDKRRKLGYNTIVRQLRLK